MKGIKIELDLDELELGITYSRLDDDGEPVGAQPMTLVDLVVAELADRYQKSAEFQRGDGAPGKLVRQELMRRLDAEIDAQIGPIVTAALGEPLVQTNHYGEPTGKTTTLTEVIEKHTRDFLTKPAKDAYSSRDTKTVLQKMVSDAVGKEFQGEIAKVLVEEKKKALAAVREVVSGIITAEIIAEDLRKKIGPAS